MDTRITTSALCPGAHTKICFYHYIFFSRLCASKLWNSHSVRDGGREKVMGIFFPFFLNRKISLSRNKLQLLLMKQGCMFIRMRIACFLPVRGGGNKKRKKKDMWYIKCSISLGLLGSTSYLESLSSTNHSFFYYLILFNFSFLFH